MNQYRTVILFAVLLTGLFVNPAVYCLAAESDESESIDPKAKKILQQMSTHLSGLNTFRADVKQSMKMEFQDMKQEFSSDQTLAMQRPNKLAIRLEKGQYGSTTICDGKTVYDYLPMTKAYTEREAPESLNDLSAASVGKPEVNPFGVFNDIFLGFLTKNDPYGELMRGVTSLQIAEADDGENLILTVVKEEVSFYVWVTKSENPLPKKITLDMSEMLKKSGAQLPPQMKEMKMNMEIAFANWKTNGDLPDDTFTFTPPAGATKSDSLMDSLTRNREPQQQESSLLGKPAPAFTLDLLGGGTFDISSQKGKKIVILDFWATWCPPCRKALPAYEKLAQEYKDKGVILIAVDLRETPDKVKSYLDEQGLDLTVALDRNGNVGTLYQAKAIPTTVIVGKDGTVQAVHTGFAAGKEDELKHQLDELLAGKKLAQDLSTDPK